MLLLLSIIHKSQKKKMFPLRIKETSDLALTAMSKLPKSSNQNLSHLKLHLMHGHMKEQANKDLLQAVSTRNPRKVNAPHYAISTELFTINTEVYYASNHILVVNANIHKFHLCTLSEQ